MLTALEAAAITVVFVQGTIFGSLRRHGPTWWRELVSCALCSGFWIGVAWYIVRTWSLEMTELFRAAGPVFWLSAFVSGVMTAVIALFLVRLLELLDRWS